MKLLKHWKPVLISFIILYGSITSGESFNKAPFLNIPNFDKIIHYIFHLLLSISFYASLYRNTTLNKKEQITITLVLIISYGIIMEMFQYYFTTHRYVEIFDVIANTLGCISGILFFYVFKKLKLVNYL